MIALTPQQVSKVAGLPDQTLRHWRATLPPLHGLNGYRACFTPPDALALLVIKRLVKAMGIAVASLRDASVPLFQLCRTTAWPVLADRALVIDVVKGSVELVPTSSPLADTEHAVVYIPMRPFAEELQNAWSESLSVSEQLELLPPALLPSQVRRAM